MIVTFTGTCRKGCKSLEYKCFEDVGFYDSKHHDFFNPVMNYVLCDDYFITDIQIDHTHVKRMMPEKLTLHVEEANLPG